MSISPIRNAGPKQLALVLVLLLNMAACGSLLDSDQPAERTYWLKPLIVHDADKNSESLPSLMLTVTAAPGLDTDRLLVLESGARLNHYSAARWPDNVPEVFESLLLRTLESTQDYSRVSGSKATRSADWQLELDVREFYSIATSSSGAGSVRVALGGYVRCSDVDHAIVVSAGADFSAERLGLIVAAHQQALDAVSEELLSQLSTACQ